MSKSSSVFEAPFDNVGKIGDSSLQKPMTADTHLGILDDMHNDYAKLVPSFATPESRMAAENVLPSDFMIVNAGARFATNQNLINSAFEGQHSQATRDTVDDRLRAFLANESTTLTQSAQNDKRLNIANA